MGEESGQGAWFVAPRVSDLEPDGEASARQCARCGESVWVEESALTLADSCAGIACPHCTGTSHSVLFIPPPDWE
jgi:hypothetical protein